MDWQTRIRVDPAICHGRACIAGTRVLVSMVLDSLAAGDAPEQVASDYHVSVEDVHAAHNYAAQLAHERVLPLTQPGSGAA